jgi:glycine cleavage system H lipoate-binding protein
MVALFVVATILLCLGIELVRDRAKQRTTAPRALQVPEERFLLPKGYFFSRTHTWVEITFSGEARIGINDFAQKIIGSIDKIEIASLNTELKKGDTLLTVHHGDRTLSIPVPISGKVLTVNESLLDSPHMLRHDPYIAGWVAVIIPKNISTELRLLTIADDAALWMRKEIGRFRDFIKDQAQGGVPAPAGVTMLDGGAPLSGVMEQLNENTWCAFQKEFLKSE